MSNATSNQNGVNQGNAPQCSVCKNFVPKYDMGQESVPTLFGGLTLSLNAVAAAFRARGVAEAEGPLEVARRYVREIARRVDEQTAVGREPKAGAEAPVNGSAGPSTDDFIGPLIGPLFRSARFTEGV